MKGSESRDLITFVVMFMQPSCRARNREYKVRAREKLIRKLKAQRFSNETFKWNMEF